MFKRVDYIYLPERFQNSHKACEFLLYQIESFLLNDSFKGLRVQTFQFAEEPAFLKEEHIFDYLKRTKQQNKLDEIITSNILNAIIADTCHFLQIALYASLQKRLSVAFSLLRKPFCYNLLVILRLYFTSDFLVKFNEDANFDTTGISQEDIQELLNFSENILLSKAIKAGDIYEIVFNPKNSDSIANISNKALHPSTTRNKNNQTEIQNLNFIFSTPEGIETQCDHIYRKLPLVFLYLNELLEYIIFDHLKLEDKIYIDRLTERADFFKNNPY